MTWVDTSRNHGFVTPDGGGGDLFVAPPGSARLAVGARVEFETCSVGKGRVVAVNVVVLGESGADPGDRASRSVGR